MADQTSDEHRDTAGLGQAPWPHIPPEIIGLGCGNHRTKNGNHERGESIPTTLTVASTRS